ncbi:transposase [Streptomyces sp. NPDC048419]|uniref:transposase n=1 Tax=Streptomyces sp. NPDC048419 TaxID=3365547 RepID=UPI00371361C9
MVPPQAIALASLAGTAPIPASSGQITRHCLNRSGDGQLNRALHTIRAVPTTARRPHQGLCGRRTAEGKPDREIKRGLKPAVARFVCSSPPHRLVLQRCLP